MKKIVFLLLMVFSLPSQAKFSPFLGVHGGYSSLQEIPNQNQKNGYLLGAKGVGSFNFSHWYLDAALGYQYERLNGSGPDLETSEAFFELDTRLKLSNHWSLGPVAKLHFGTDSRRDLSDREPETGFLTGGAKIMYENYIQKSPYRIELNLHRSITDISGDYYAVILGFQIGWPWEKKKEQPQVVVVPVMKERGIVKEIIRVEESSPDLTVTMQDSMIGFKVGKADISNKTRVKLVKLGKLLAQHEAQYQEIRVGGHTDTRGNLKINQSLSEKRAQVVKEILISSGVSESKITSKGYNFSMPLADGENEESWAKNRRTEIQFFGVKDAGELNEKINEIMGQ